ncbi:MULTISPECIES: TlpA disulfide reductase family protein [Flavobacterium]|uniref:Thiol-disulfide oxidoreductase ResA n=2 Tax=Flavobacterium TaxID=237 RepID=A0A437UEQ5_9FLAO|nr:MULTISPECIES: TlpA disulfide reductase family protein [Flavobacterium]OWP82831.1 thiol:disulfide interchange protein [Flavobacterium davisii]QYS88593.1 TlpA family protein disulfide reductase [Flavobacterium davisii]RVU92041.1 TlpA family protein disulfide reductase [Flavobacterium columnare]SPE77318.1 Thiol-disulfide oxidoreductase ResA [Flavobacterium columnare]
MLKVFKNLFFFFIASSALAQQKIPNIVLKDLDSKEFSIQKDFEEKDKLYVFTFWATWCGPCIKELEEMNEIQEEWKQNLNFEIIAVSIDDTRTQKRVKPLVKGKEWTYKVLLDTNQDFKRAMGVVNPPFTMVVKNRKVVYIQNGYTPGSEQELYNKLKTL